MLMTLKALGRVFARPRQLAVAIAIAALYIAATFPVMDWALIPGMPGLHPALALLVVLAVLGGAPAVWGALAGGVVTGIRTAGITGGGLGGSAAEGLAAALLALVAWKSGWVIRLRTDPSEEVRARITDVLWDCVVLSLLCGLVYATFLGWFGELLETRSYAFTALVSAVNACAVLIVLVFPLFLVLNPIARAAEVVWQDPRGDAAQVGWARAGRAVQWLGILVCAVIGFLQYAPEFHGLAYLSQPHVAKGAIIWAPQALFITAMWFGALLG